MKFSVSLVNGYGAFIIMDFHEAELVNQEQWQSSVILEATGNIKVWYPILIAVIFI